VGTRRWLASQTFANIEVITGFLLLADESRIRRSGRSGGLFRCPIISEIENLARSLVVTESSVPAELHSMHFRFAPIQDLTENAC
jgi:hypothetical protein